MNHIAKLFFAVLIGFGFTSCEKNINQVTVEGATPPVLTSNKSGTTLPLAFATQSEEAIRLTWTNPNYMLSTGPSSHDVSYRLEIDTAGANFTNPGRKTISSSKNLSLSITQGELNDYLLNQLVLAVGVPHDIEFRLTASLTNSALSLSSNVLKYRITPYAIPPKVNPPASGKLFIVGGATPGGWNNPVPANQEFTKVTNTLYEITIPLSAGGSYLLLPVNGSWDTKYGAVGNNNTNDPNTDDFRQGGGDLIAPSTAGTYKIQVDFQRGKFTLTKM